MDRQELYNHLKNQSKVLDNDTIAGAFAAVDRKLFVEPDYEFEAYEDYAVPIGFGTVIPQPTKTAFMIELLEPHQGDNILVVGSGSGWSCALIAHCIGAEGKVVGVA